MPAEGIARAREFVDREHGALAQMQRCAACVMDPAECRTPSMLLVCNVPIEFTVIGDVKVLMEAGADAAVGNPVDRIDVALAGRWHRCHGAQPYYGRHQPDDQGWRDDPSCGAEDGRAGQRDRAGSGGRCERVPLDKLDAFVRKGELNEVIDNAPFPGTRPYRR